VVVVLCITTNPSLFLGCVYFSYVPCLVNFAADLDVETFVLPSSIFCHAFDGCLDTEGWHSQ